MDNQVVKSKDGNPSTGLSWATALLTVIAGVVLIIIHVNTSILETVVKIIGILVALVGLFMFIAQMLQRRERRNWWYVTLGVAMAIVGLWLWLDAGFFVGFVVYVLALVLVLDGVWHIISLRRSGRLMHVPFWLWLIPALMIVGGVTIFFIGFRVAISAIVLIVGIGLVLSAVNGFAESVNTMRNRPAK